MKYTKWLFNSCLFIMSLSGYAQFTQDGPNTKYEGGNVIISNPLETSAGIRFQDAQDPGGQFAGLEYNAATNALTLNHAVQAANTAMMTILPSNFVGIGTTPTSILHIKHESPMLTIGNSYETAGGIRFQDAQDPGGQFAGLEYNSATNALTLNQGVQGVSTPAMTILPSRFVGIGTTNPQSTVDINGGTTGDVVLRLEADTDNAGSEADNPRIEMYQDNKLIYAHLGFNEDVPTVANIFQISMGSPDGFVRDALSINPYNGYVGLGTLDPKARLAVNGIIYAEEVKVMTNIQQPDYVFEDDYELRSISELDAYIKEHRHLPNIPSASEVEESGGREIGEMQVKLLEKIEELTLYVIDLKKENLEQSEENAELKMKNEELKEGFAALLKRIEKLENSQ